MALLKIASLAVLLLAVSAAPSDKKINLHDIEEDNLKSEKENVSNNLIVTTIQPLTTDANVAALELLKRGNIGSIYRGPTPPLQQARYVHQYAVDEPSEKPSTVNSNIPPSATSQQAMIGYLSNTPMHIYLIPRGYGQQTEETINTPTAAASEASYTAPGIAQLKGNYVEVPTYLVPSGKGYVSQYTPQVTYVTYDHQSAAFLTGPAASAGLSNPVPSFYQVPPPPFSYKMFHGGNYRYLVEPDEIKNPSDNKYPSETEYPSENELEAPQQYDKETEKPFYSGSPQYKYVTQAPPRDNDNSGAIDELPAPNPLLFKSSPYPMPKALPETKPKFVYGKIKYSPDPAPTMRPFDYLRNQANSLYDSYVPSKSVMEYMNKGYAKDPMAAYEALSSSKRLAMNKPLAPTPRAYERGFLPNQMYQTAAGGITYGQITKASNQPKPIRN